MVLLLLITHRSTVDVTASLFSPVKDDGGTSNIAIVVDQLMGAVGTSGATDTNLLSFMGNIESPFRNEAISTRVSSQCWQTAIEILQGSAHSNIHTKSAASLCFSLTEIQLKRLTLEISNCHMQDVDKKMYQSPSVQKLCTTSAITVETVQMCLQYLTDIGFHTYTQFLPYVQILCTRKTQELFLDYQQEVMRTTALNYARMMSQSSEQLAMQTEQMKKLLEIPSLIQNQVATELKEQLLATKSQLNSLIHNQSVEMNSLVTDMVEQLQRSDLEHRDHIDDWTNYQSSMLLQQSREMERQRLVIEEHRFEVQNLSETITQSSKHMQPLLGLQSIMKLATDGYSWVTFLLHFLCTFNIIWVVTRLERCHQVRSYLFGLVCMEAIVEIVLTCAVQHDMLSDANRSLYINELRRWAIVAECFTYIFGIVASFLNATSHTKPRETTDMMQELPLTRNQQPTAGTKHHISEHDKEIIAEIDKICRCNSLAKTESILACHSKPPPDANHAVINFQQQLIHWMNRDSMLKCPIDSSPQPCENHWRCGRVDISTGMNLNYGALPPVFGSIVSGNEVNDMTPLQLQVVPELKGPDGQKRCAVLSPMEEPVAKRALIMEMP
jgi:hypothetical protein